MAASCVVLALTIVAALGVVAGLRAQVYWSRVSVLLLGPQTAFQPNPVQGAPPDLPVVAALVVLRLNDGPKAPISASTTATLYGEGTTQGHRIAVRNLGSQWDASFGDPIIDIEVVGPSREWVLTEIERLASQASTELDRLQRETGADPAELVSASLVPVIPSVTRIGPSRTRLIASVGMLYAIGILLVFRYACRRGARGEEPDV